MGRNNQDKGKGIASSSGDQDLSKRKRDDEDGPPGGPKWKSGNLSVQPREYQAILFAWKMGKRLRREDGFVCERAVDDDLAPFEIHKSFEKIGWEAVLRVYDRENTKFYMGMVEEWVGSLKCPVTKKPEDMKLVGKVRGKEVTMSRKTLAKIAPFDSLGEGKYSYPSAAQLYDVTDKHPKWHSMINELFLPGTFEGKWLKNNLIPKAKLLMTVVLHNVMPRKSDLMEVRLPDIPILYMLMTGWNPISYGHLVMNNIWTFRDNKKKQVVPHCRLIVALLKLYKMIEDTTPSIEHAPAPLSIRRMGYGYAFTEGGRYHTLKTNGVVWKVPNPDYEGGDEEEEEEEQQQLEQVPMDEDQGGYYRGAGGSYSGTEQYGYSFNDFDPNWAWQGSMSEVVEQARPSDYGSWEEPSRASFDHSTMRHAIHELNAKRYHDEQLEQMRRWNSMHAYAREEEINARYRDNQQRRAHDAWHAGEQFVADPPYIDYASLPAYDGSVSYPEPAIHHSNWIDPHQARETLEDPPQERGSGAFGFGGFLDSMTSIFGPPPPRNR